ncbi:hypothetical protein N9N67_08050 [Bacteriovoracaceae bacterium]|nr:hypothetical protein [Bacteriovoracaceae bacterium]
MQLNCPICNQIQFKKCGSFFRKNDSRVVQRYQCKNCNKYFSNATFSDCYKQKKRRVNDLIFKLFSSAASMRRIAFIANVDRKTVARKLIFLGLRCKRKNLIFLENCLQVKHLQFDDLITKEHTKLKPLTITVAVDADRRTILGAKVSQIPAFGHLASLARKKYGSRVSHHRKGVEHLFNEIQPYILNKALIRSDLHKLYPELVRKFFPQSYHERFKGDKAAIVGQGELKRKKNDPLFSINHTLAMLRDNIRRLVRRSWCLSKCSQMLQHHLEIYINFHNRYLV